MRVDHHVMKLDDAYQGPEKQHRFEVERMIKLHMQDHCTAWG